MLTQSAASFQPTRQNPCVTDRIIDISDDPAILRIELGNLIVARGGDVLSRVPLDEIGALIVSHRAVQFTHAVVAGLAGSGGVFVVCDEKHLPVGMLLPLQGHFAQTERFAKQAALKPSTRKRLWQQIVRAKIRAQSRLLKQLHGYDAGLSTLAGKVRSGDSQNAEAQASRRYWQLLFGDAFRRDYQANNQNRHLNYGYAVLRGMVTRAICGSGLHPSLGLHHKNRYNPFCLADDLIEPFRPLVDAAVVDLVKAYGPDVAMDKVAKRGLLEALMSRYKSQGEERTLFDWSTRVAQSLAAIIDGEEKNLFLPPL